MILTFVEENLFETEYEFIEIIPVYGYVSPCSVEPLIFGLQKDLFSLTKKGRNRENVYDARRKHHTKDYNKQQLRCAYNYQNRAIQIFHIRRKGEC